MREQEGRDASPSAAILDSHSVKSTQTEASTDLIAVDAGMKIKGVRRHILSEVLE